MPVEGMGEGRGQLLSMSPTSPQGADVWVLGLHG